MGLVLYLQAGRGWGGRDSSIFSGAWGCSSVTVCVFTPWPLCSPRLPFACWLNACVHVSKSFCSIRGRMRPWLLSRMFLANTFVLFPVIHEVHFLQVHTRHCHLMYSVPFLHFDSTYKIRCPLVKLEQFLSKTGLLGQLFYKGMALGKGGILYKSIDCQKRDTWSFKVTCLILSVHILFH